MKKPFEQYIGYVVILIVIGILAYSARGLFADSAEYSTDIVNKNSDSNQGFNTISSGDTSPGGVSIDLTPETVVDGKLEVKISANTHSVSLSEFDLSEITVLKFGDKSIKPSSAPALSGHHSNGNLIFDVGQDIDSFTITIKDIPKVQERIFKWGE